MKILTWAISALLALVILAVGLTYFVPGFHLYTVRSDSMHHVFKMGDSVVTVPVGFLGKKVEVGAIVTFQRNGETITHRVVQIESGSVITKGDANNAPDAAPVFVSEIKGIYLFTVPGAGYFSVFLHTRIGWLATLIIPSSLLIALIIRDILKETFKVSKEDVV
jgi:signal peptidase